MSLITFGGLGLVRPGAGAAAAGVVQGRWGSWDGAATSATTRSGRTSTLTPGAAIRARKAGAPLSPAGLTSTQP